MSEKTKYKYLVNIDGNGVAYRFTRELSFKSVILKVDSTKEMWYLSFIRTLCSLYTNQRRFI